MEEDRTTVVTASLSVDSEEDVTIEAVDDRGVGVTPDGCPTVELEGGGRCGFGPPLKTGG